MAEIDVESHRRDWVIMLAFALLAVVARLIPGPRLIDDAYITYRYARNILSGLGFVYNAGESVLGTTTPLYTFILVAMGAVGGAQSLPVLSPVINALADGFGVALLYQIGRHSFGHRLPAGALAFLWSVSPRSVTFAIGGMETSVYLTLTVAAMWFYLSNRFRLTAVFTALTLLTRPDALIWAGPLGLAIMVIRWNEHRDQPRLSRLPWVEAFIFGALVVPWLIFAWITFGSPVPHSVSAKSVAYLVSPTQGLVAFVQNFAIPFNEFSTFGQFGALVGFIVYLPLSALGVLYICRARKQFIPIAIFPWVYAAVFSVANPLIFRWYIMPPILIYIVLVVGGAWGLARRIIGEERGRRAFGAVMVIWALLSLNEWKLHPDHGADRPAPDMAWYQLELVYAEAAHRLQPLVNKNTVIAAGDIGVVGWYSGARILDTLGLISPEATRYYPISPSMLGDAPYAVAPDLIIDEQPDYVIILETYGRNGLLKDARFKQMYHLRETIETDIYGSHGMLIYERADVSR